MSGSRGIAAGQFVNVNGVREFVSIGCRVSQFVSRSYSVSYLYVFIYITVFTLHRSTFPINNNII